MPAPVLTPFLRRRFGLALEDFLGLVNVLDRTDEPQQIANQLYELLDGKFHNARVMFAEHGLPKRLVADEYRVCEENYSPRKYQR